MDMKLKTLDGNEFELYFNSENDNTITIIDNRTFSEIDIDISHTIDSGFVKRDEIVPMIQKSILDSGYGNTKDIINKLCENIPQKNIEIVTPLHDISEIALFIPDIADNFKLKSLNTGRELSYSDNGNIQFITEEGTKFTLSSDDNGRNIPYSDRTELAKTFENLNETVVSEFSQLKKHIDFENLKQSNISKKCNEVELL